MPRLAAGQAAKDVAAADHDDHLHAQIAHFADLLGHALHRFGVDADAAFAAQGFAAEFEQDPAVLRAGGLFHFWKGMNVIGARRFSSPGRKRQIKGRCDWARPDLFCRHAET